MQLDAYVAQTIVLGVIAMAFIAMGIRLRRDDTTSFVLLLLFTMLPSVWLPQLARDLVLSLALAVVGSFAGESTLGKLVWAVALGGTLLLLSFAMPGGASVIVLGLTLIALVLHGRKTFAHYRRLSTAKRLDPTAPPRSPVEIGGTISLEKPPSVPPNFDLPDAAGWRLAFDPTHCSPSTLRLETDVGPVLIDLATITLEHTRHAHSKLDSDVPTEPPFGPGAMLAVIDAGKAAHVLGIPEWERAPEGSGGYRNAPVVPLFGKGSTLYLIPESEVDARTLWHLTLTAGFALAALMVAIAHSLGHGS